MSSEEGEKDELSKLISEGETKGREIAKKSSDFVQFGQHTSDLANASLGVLKYITPRGIDWNPQKRVWEYVNKQQDAILGHMNEIEMPTMTASSSTANYTMTAFSNFANISNFVMPNKKGEAKIATKRLSDVINRQIEKDKVTSLLQQYGLSDAPTGQKSPHELFQTAWAAFEKPVLHNSASTSLIPIRESIIGVVAAILRRKITQERTHKNREKLLSIGKQLFGNAIPQWAIKNMAEHYEKLVDELSGSKQKSYSREEWEDLLQRATLFLRELLESLDKSKMTNF